MVTDRRLFDMLATDKLRHLLSKLMINNSRDLFVAMSYNPFITMATLNNGAAMAIQNHGKSDQLVMSPQDVAAFKKLFGG